MMILRVFPAPGWPVAILAPAALAICYLNQPGLYRALIFDGGWTTRIYIAAWVMLTPYLGWFIMAAGRLVLAVGHRKAGHPIDQFFLGAATLILLGFGLGALSVLFAWLVIGIATAIILWDTADLKRPRLDRPDASIICALALLLVLCAIVFFNRAALPDVTSSDVQQLYAPYLAEVARNHSIWLASDNPIFSDFETGHANGLHLMLATLLPPHVAQIISFLYYVAIGATIFELARFILPLSAMGPRWQLTQTPIALALAILGLASPMMMKSTLEGGSTPSGLFAIEFGKYHLQTSAFLLYLLLLVIRTGRNDRLAASVCGFAITVSYPLYTAFVGLISTLGILTRVVRCDKPGLILSVQLGCVAVAGGLLAFAVNFYYLGVPATNPYSIFRNTVQVERFARFGSLDILDYFVLAQSLQVSDFFSGRGLEAFARQLGLVVAAAGALATVMSLAVWLDAKPSSEDLGFFERGMKNAAGLVLVSAYVASIRFLDLTLRIPSLARLSDHVSCLLPLVVVAAGFWGTVILRRLVLQTASGRFAPNTVVWIFLATCAWAIASFPLRQAREDGAILVLKGTPLAQFPHVAWNWKRCEELHQSTDAERILPLNGYRALVPCYFSPLLPRRKIVHTYQSDVARDFRTIVLGTPDNAEAALRSLDVNRFYIEKGNCDFWLNGYAKLFHSSELKKRFAVHHETDGYWILAWKGANEPLRTHSVDEISRLIARSRSIYREAYGIEPIEQLKHPSPLFGQGGNINALERLFRCE